MEVVPAFGSAWHLHLLALALGLLELFASACSVAAVGPGVVLVLLLAFLTVLGSVWIDGRSTTPRELHPCLLQGSLKEFRVQLAAN